VEEDVSLVLSAVDLVLEYTEGLEETYVTIAEWRSTMQCPWSCEESGCRSTHHLYSCMRATKCILADSVAKDIQM
jgi:hypothetical protein